MATRFVHVISLALVGIVHLMNGCDDLNSQACLSMAATTPDLCLDVNMANTVCPKFCNRCRIRCYSCNKTLSDYHLCTTTVHCNTDEVCMRRELRSIVDEHEEFELTCAKKSFCDDPWQGLSMFGKRAIKPRDVSVSCCTSDLCNKPVPTTVRPIIESPATVRPPTTIPSTAVPTTTTAATTTTGHCTGCCKDFMIAVDESRSINPVTMKQFLHHVVSNLQISSTKTLISLGTFDQSSRTVFDIGDHLTKYSTLAAIDAAYFHGGTGDINAGVDYLIQHATTPAGGDRPAYPNVLMIITDSTSKQINPNKERELHSKADHVISVEIGSTHYKYLASSQDYQVQIHSQSYLYNVYQTVSNLVCKEPSSYQSSNQGSSHHSPNQGLFNMSNLMPDYFGK